MLQGLDERLRKEKANAELDDRIVAEFDDGFVTQVYNYLSLGFPATARPYDDELSKISHISVSDLERDDTEMMDLWEPDSDYTGSDEGSPKLPIRPRKAPIGHIMSDGEEKPGLCEEDRCPRWKALKLYILEWARQHPDLSAIRPLPSLMAFGERRGSWMQ